MERSSARSSVNSKPTYSHSAKESSRRNMSHSQRPVSVSEHDAYIFALKAAYLSYLLQPRQKRVQHVANTSKPIQRSSTSINDMVKDFSLIRDSKSTRFPHGFMTALDKRLTGVLVGQEKMPEYNDATIKRTCGAFLNEFKNPTFRKSMEKDRRVEDLLLIFFSKATSELQKGKPADDDSWKLMVDRHVALFVRLISTTLSHNDWTRDRPELTSRLKTLETKLLQHDQDLADASQRNGGQGGTSVEVEVPRSYEVRDMPLVIRVCRIFSKPTVQAQNDINAHKDEWTEKEALKDLKEYQSHMMLNTRITPAKNDFDLDDAYEMWRKNEYSDLSQMMLALVQSDPTLAKTTSSGSLPSFKPPMAVQMDSGYSDLSKSTSSQSGDRDSSYVIDLPVDMSGLNLGDSSPIDSGKGSIDASHANFMFIPPDARAYYRHVLKTALTADLQDDDVQPSAATDEAPAMRLLSEQSTELLNEIAHRWRVPQFSRLVLFLDVVREKLENREITLDTLDSAFGYVKAPPSEPKKSLGKTHKLPVQVSLFDREKWTVADHVLLQSALSSIHDALLRDLFDTFQHGYENKPPSLGPVLTVLDEHIYSDPSFSRNQEEMDAFAQMMTEQLKEKARGKYHDMLAKSVPDNSTEWEFFNVIKLGQTVTATCQKIQKRYKGALREVMGVKPLAIFVQEVLPAFAGDAKELVVRIKELATEKGEDVPVQDGFELYKELVEIRGVYAQALPGRQFEFHIEGILQDFVWRWIEMTDSKLLDWIEGAVTHDDFKVRQDAAAKERGDPPSDDERHSQSAIDIYRIFNQSIDQIIKLEWDDDLQYAKFMTAVSKSIGKGVARYCELLETKFAREMNRQTPEQEARAQQKQHEKWLAVARDVWTTGGIGQKIEPFQFWPESFVKINNIEYATLQLDKVEQEMNVDACVAAIQKYEPPPPSNMRKRGENKFMFTIKIIEAEDLKAGDMNGLSDPYVVLGDEYQKRLAKTRTVYQSLNPRWDETIDILTTGPLNVIATVWDWDHIGDHDCLGRTSLKLDPNHFNDYLPREYWLDLDTQGRVLVRVTMEGERDDIQFYFGKAFRTLKRAERDMTRRITDKLSAYINQCLSRRTLRAITAGPTSGIAGVTMSKMTGYFSKVSGQVSGRPNSVATPSVQSSAGLAETANNALKPLLQYFDDNFAIMKQTLTDSAMIMVMTRLWKEVLVTIEGLLVPPLSDKLSAQKPLRSQEVDVVYKWLQILFDFFHAFDHERGEADGVPMDVLKSPKYHDLQNLNFFYFESTDNLVRTSEAMASATLARQQEQTNRLNRLSAPAGFQSPSLGGTRRSKSIMNSRNLGTMKKAKEEKRKEAQADPNDDMILRILRMRPEAERYLKDRSRQKERLAAAAAAEAIVRQSLQSRQHGHSQSVGGASRGAGGQGLSRGGVGRHNWGTIRE